MLGPRAFSSASLSRPCPERAVGDSAAAILQAGFDDGLWTGGGGGAEPDLPGVATCQDPHSGRERGSRKFGSPVMWEHLQASCRETKLFPFIIVCREKSRLLGT